MGLGRLVQNGCECLNGKVCSVKWKNLQYTQGSISREEGGVVES
jgi:hypothetical protein